MKTNLAKKLLIVPLTLAAVFSSLSNPLDIEESTANAKSYESNKTSELPLGEPGLKEKRSTQHLAPGVTHTAIIRGERSSENHFTVDIAFLSKPSEAKDLANRLETKGFKPMIKTIKNSPHTDIEKDILGYLIRVGSFEEQSEADNLKKQLGAAGFSGLRVTYTGYDDAITKGPWSIHVLEIDRNQFKGTLSTTLAMDKINGKETVSNIAERTNSLAAINGGYFVVGSKDGTPGDLAGISVLNGRLVSEAINNRSSLILSGSKDKAQIKSLSTSLSVTSSDGAIRELDGVNRTNGLIRNCGGVGGDLYSEQPMHDVTCTDHSELIQYKSIYGSETPKGKGLEVVLSEAGEVVEVRDQRGGKIPATGSVIAGTGEATEWLKEHAQKGMKLYVQTRLLSDKGRISLTEQTNVINGGPRLLENNKYAINAAAEGFYHDEEFFYRFGIYRHPRTLAGIKPNGNLLFITVDGRNPEKSIGINFEESAKLMKALGAKDAINLDGGGSTAMAIDEHLISDPSDSSGERPIADAITILP
ncbi:phosphodiester glycosidase family protein [Rossellomorea sp. BNER]|uniref:phosphodiester glycosidase family protein n=1 Tax=Rossellomorea sp. BNER TaxID=2962031 RepID=UPI003AF2E8D0|nr:phosphodiester glycosidase family protein [Rossellomorea sp. BNER]